MQPVFALISFEHVLLFALIFLVLFGGKKVGEFGKGLGEGIRNFKAGLKGDEEKKDEAAVEVKK
ncbi:MAG: twin-arginine translocase TatA/TatE family subunit [Bryobacteraceae bacterium]